MEAINDEILALASDYSDWHIDLVHCETSVLFKSNAGEEKDADSAPVPIPEFLRSFFDILCRMLREHQIACGVPAFTLTVGSLRFRVERIRPERYALRLVRGYIVSLDELNLGKSACDILMDREFKSGGLILIAGETGSGKSTTAAATVVARLNAYGGYCLTVESPIECVFEGFHNNGYVEQVDATLTGFKYEVCTAMRKFPSRAGSMFYFGEVLEEEAAAELVRLIGRGHLVITTIHAKDIIRAVEMLVAFAERGGETYARQMIGQNLRAVIYQRLQNGKPIVNCFKANDTIKNVICNTSTPLYLLANEIDMVRRAQRVEK